MEPLMKALGRLLAPMYSATARDVPFQVFVNQGLDRMQQGAPARVRSAVASARSPEDKLKVLKQFHPDAVPVGDGSNFLYFDQESRKPVLFDEEGLSLKDAIDVAPFAGEVIGGAIGAAAGAGSTAGLGSVAGAAGGAVAGREIAERAMRGLTGTRDPRGVGEQARDAVLTGGANAIGQGLGNRLSRRLLGNAMTARETVEVASRTGVDLSLPQAIGSDSGDRLMNSGLRQTPGASGMIEGFANRQRSQIEAASNKILQAISPVSPPADAARASAVLRESFVRMGDDFQVQREALDESLQAVVGGDTPVQVQHVQEALQTIQQGIQSSEGVGTRIYKDALDWLTLVATDAAENGGQIPFRMLRQARSAVGRIMDTPDVGNQTRDNLRRVYGALSEDLGAAVRSSGPEGARLWRLHNRFVRFGGPGQNGTMIPGRESLGEGGVPINLGALTRVVQRDSDLAALNFALQGSRQSGQRLAALRQTMTPDEWSHLASAVWQDLGFSGPVGQAAGDWSPAVFLRNFGKLDTTSKRALFGGSPLEGTIPAIEDLVKVAEAARRSSSRGNHSNTAGGLASMALLGSVGAIASGVQGAGFGAAASIGGSAALAKAFTSPALVRAISSGVRALRLNGNALPAVMSRIGAAAASTNDEEVIDWVNDMIESLTSRAGS